MGRFFKFGAVCLVLVFLLLQIVPSTVFAASPGQLDTGGKAPKSNATVEWVDRTTIKVFGGKSGFTKEKAGVFRDRDLDNKWHFVNNRQDACSDSNIIGINDEASGNTHVDVTIPSNFENGNFTEFNGNRGYMRLYKAQHDKVGNQDYCELVHGWIQSGDLTESTPYGSPTNIGKTDNKRINFWFEGEPGNLTVKRADGNSSWNFKPKKGSPGTWERVNDGDCKDTLTFSGRWRGDLPRGKIKQLSFDNGCKANGLSEIDVFMGNTQERPEVPDDTSLGSGGNQGENPGDTEATCESQPLSLSWIFCPIINGLAEASDEVFSSIIQPLLEVPSVDVGAESSTRSVWNQMRLFGNIILVIAMLVIVFGQAIGGGLIDAYTAKKVLPRILIAAVLLNLSIYIVATVVDVTNLIGRSLNSLIVGAFGAADEAKLKLNGATSGLGLTTLVAGGAAIWFLGGALIQFLLLFVLLPAFVAFLGVLATLIIRLGLIQFLIIIAPVAFALYCLPNTEKYFKQWWSLLFKTAMVYPIIAVVFAMADVMALSLNRINDGVIGDIAVIVLLVIPMFLIPFAFKLAGGAIGSLYGTFSGLGKKATEGIKGNVNDQNSLRNRSKRQLGEAATLVQARRTDAGRRLGASNWQKSTGWLADRFGNVDARLARYNALSKQSQDQMSETGRDALRYAAAGYASGGRFFNSKGKEISRNEYTRGKQLYGNTATGIAQSLEYTLRKAQTDKDFGSFRTAFARNAQQEGWKQDEIADAWAAATFPHKAGLAASEWYSMPQLQSDGSLAFRDISNDVVSTPDRKSSYSSFVGDLHKTRLSYNLPARDQDYRAMFERQTALEDKILSGAALTDEEATQLAETYEVFDSASHAYTTAGAAAAGVSGAPESTTTATAGTAAAKPIIEQAVKQRQARGFGLESVDAATRNITHTVPVAGPPTPVVGAGGAIVGATPPPSVTTVVKAATVTGDASRPDIPRRV